MDWARSAGWPEYGELERLDVSDVGLSSKRRALTLREYARLRRVVANTAQRELDAAVGIRVGKFKAEELGKSLIENVSAGVTQAGRACRG
jgi:hypothetical protein